MIKFYSISRCLLLSIVMFALPALVAAESASSYQARLDDIRDKISGVVGALGQNKNQRNTIRTNLKKLEVKIARSAKKLRKTKRKHNKSVKKLKITKLELKKLRKSLKKQRALLANQIRSAYAMGQQPQLKMLLNQQDPTEMGRAMVYYRYLNQVRSQEIERFIGSIVKEKELEISVRQNTANLAALVKKRVKEKKQLTAHKVQRKKILIRLNSDINHQQLTLDDLNSSRGRIEDLLMSLGRLLADIPAEAINHKPFGKLKGKLPWPVKGSFKASFGTSQRQGDLKWSGVIIKSDYDESIRAVADGQIAFADWLQGYGFITIIDHNDGYMSLYGYSQELYKEVGDWVEASEVIATVGDSGGQSSPGLYFEIRKQGKPINPKKWCSSAVKHIVLLED